MRFSVIVGLAAIVAALHVAGCGQSEQPGPAPGPAAPGPSVTPTAPAAPAAKTITYPPITAGPNHTCVIRPNGEMACWGTNLNSELGDGTAQDRPTPVAVVGLQNVVQAAAGLAHTCAVNLGGEVWCWGLNDEGQVGDGSPATVRSTPVKVQGVAGAIQVTAGEDFSCALRSDGKALCWGSGSSGKLGNGGTEASRTPVEVAGLADVAFLASGQSHTCAATKAGEVWCWGSNGSKQAALPGDASEAAVPTKVAGLTGITTLAGGDSHTCAANAQGALWCWGYNRYGELGIGQAGDSVGTPTQVTTIQNVTQIALGENHSCAVTSSGQGFCWGHCGYGNLGWAERPSGEAPAPGPVANLADAVAFATGHSHTCAVRRSGAVACWGGANDYHLGALEIADEYHPTDVIPALAALAPAQAVPAAFAPDPAIPLQVSPSFELGEGFACALREGNGRIQCWGYNSNGQLGVGNTVSHTSDTVEVTGIVDAVEVDIGGNRTCARRANGTVACWGYLGLAWGTSQTSSSLPVPLPGVTDAAELALGPDGQLCLRRTSGAVQCLSGANLVDVPGLTGVAQLESGYGHACARLENGEVWCWGSGSYGVLGNGATDSSQAPVQVEGLRDAQAISAGHSHICALRRGGRVSCWGQNSSGQLGDGRSGDGVDSARPVDAAGVGDAVSLSVGRDHTCALRRNGEVRCWGAGSSWAIGVAVPENESPPAVVARPTAVIAGTAPEIALMGRPAAIHCETNVSCLEYDGGQLTCWGTSGALGPGTLAGLFTERARIPTPLVGVRLRTAPPAAATP